MLPLEEQATCVWVNAYRIFGRSLADKMRWEPRLCSAHASQKLAQRSSGRLRHEHDLHEPLVRWLLPSAFTRPSLPVNRPMSVRSDNPMATVSPAHGRIFGRCALAQMKRMPGNRPPPTWRNQGLTTTGRTAGALCLD